MTVRKTWSAGQKVQSVTSVVLVNATAKTVDTTVPANEEWLLEYIRSVNGDDVNRLVTHKIFLEAGKTSLLRFLNSGTVTPGNALQTPDSARPTSSPAISSAPMVISLKAGNTIEVVWNSGGASTGATDADGLVVEYRRLGI